MTTSTQIIRAILATFLFTANVAAHPTAEVTGLFPQAGKPLSCFVSSDVVADQGWEMWMNAHAFCKTSDAAILPVNRTMTSPSYQAGNGNYYNLEVTNLRCATQQVGSDSCMSLFNEILVDCNSGVNEGSVGGLVSTDCGHVALLPSTEKLDPPTSQSDEAVLAARDIYPDGCNPPVWSACSPAEKSSLLANACDFMGCLQAGNCATC